MIVEASRILRWRASESETRLDLRIGDLQRPDHSRTFWTSSAPLFRRLGIAAIAAVLGVTPLPRVAGQEPDSRQTVPRSRDSGDDVRREGTRRRIPDALRFAHGLLRQRKFDLAAEEYERFLATRPSGADRLDALFGLANARLDQGRFAESLRAFGEFLEAAPEESRARTARYRLGELSYLTGDLPAARRALEAFTADKAAHPALETAWTYLGDVCFALNDMPAARAAYEQSLADHPRGRLAARARYGLARTLAVSGDRDRALRLLRELVRQGGPEWVDRAWLQIGSIELAAGRPTEAVEALTSVERAVPDSPLKGEARLRRARALDRLGRADEAARLLRELAADPTNPLAPQASLEVATIELEHGRPTAALAAADMVLKRGIRSPLRPALLFRSAEALRKLNRLDEAQAQFLRVIEMAPDDPWADDALLRAAGTALDRKDAAAARRLSGQLAARYPKSPLRGEARLVEARAAASAGDHKAAARLLEVLLNPPVAAAGQFAPPLPAAVAQDARYELALAYRALGRSADAENVLAKLAEEPSGPVAVDAQFLLGQAQVEAGRYAEAIAPLERYLAANPRGDVAEFALADLVAAQLGAAHPGEADKALEALSRRYPDGKTLPRARLRVAEAALAARRYDRAAEQFRLVAGYDGPGDASGTRVNNNGKPAAAVDPALRVRGLAGLGRTLQEMGRPAEAAAAFAALLELAPSDPAAPEMSLAHARALESANRPEDALAAYKSAAKRLARRPEGPRAALARARLLAKLGRHDAAATEYEHLLNDRLARDALAKIGATPDALLAALGWSLVDASKAEQADRVFARLLQEYPESPHAADARFNLAETANQARNYKEVVRLLGPMAAAKPAAPSRSGRPSDPARPAPAGDSSDRLLPAVLYRLGRTQIELRDWPAAAATLDRLIAQFPENPYRREARFLRAEAALQLGDATAAEAGFAALWAEPSPPGDPPGLRRSVRLEQIRSWVALKRWKDLVPAIQALRGELKPDDPGLAELDYALGQAQLGLGRMEEARKSFQAVIEARKGGELAAQAQLMRGETYFHEDHLREAIREFLRVDILYDAPRWQAAALLEAGKAYERLDQWADAAETYNGLVARFPQDPEAPTARSRAETARQRAAKSSHPSRPGEPAK
jgi:TolA-binding protein